MWDGPRLRGLYSTFLLTEIPRNPMCYKEFRQYRMKPVERRLIVVAEVFEISGRCICPLPAVPPEVIAPVAGERLRPGDSLELRRPDGTLFKTAILYGLGWLNPKGGLVIQLEPSITPDDLRAGTEIWKVERAR